MKKIPPMIVGNGLLAAIAFAIEEKFNKPANRMEFRSKGHAAIFDALAIHLSSEPIDIVTGVKNAKDLIRHLVEADSQTLKLATAEALEWLGYARRFVSSGEGDSQVQEEEDEA